MKIKYTNVLLFINYMIYQKYTADLPIDITVSINNFGTSDNIKLLNKEINKEINLCEMSKEWYEQYKKFFCTKKLKLLPLEYKNINWKKEYNRIENSKEWLYVTDNYMKKENPDIRISGDIREIPKEISNLIYLLQLRVYSTGRIKEIPVEIGKLINLEDLRIDNNKIKIVPGEIGNLIRLKVLYLSRNKIENIPDEIGNLVELKQLTLDWNQITFISKQLIKLINLKHLWINRNKINYKLMRNIKVRRKLRQIPDFSYKN